MAVVKGKRNAQGKRAAPQATSPSVSLKKKGKGPPPSQQKTKSAKSLVTKKPRKKEYTAEQLGVPKLNTITPVGVQKPRGKKKGKVFVDDPHTMQTILSIVNAETEGKIESKMMRARQMEEIREARQKEAEAKEQSRKARIEDKKEEIRRGRKKIKPSSAPSENASATVPQKPKKKVSFG